MIDHTNIHRDIESIHTGLDNIFNPANGNSGKILVTSLYSEIKNIERPKSGKEIRREKRNLKRKRQI